MDIYVGYYEFGLDLLFLFNVVQEIGVKIGVDFFLMLLFEYIMIVELVVYFVDDYLIGEVDDIVCQFFVLMQDFLVVVIFLLEIGEDIVIIGMVGCYFRVKNIQEFWEYFKVGIDCIIEIFNLWWEWKENNGLDLFLGKLFLKWGGFIEDVDCFDF